MSSEPDVRCPYCNGTGGLPKETVKRYEVERDEHAVRLFKIGKLWGALADVSALAKKKSVTLERLQTAIRVAYGRCGGLLTLDEVTGDVPRG